jgi:hypothetical protein
MTTKSVCFVDTETTGLDPERHEIWEVGLILPDGTEREWQLPVDLAKADPIALNIGRFHDRRDARAVDSLQDFARDFVGFTRGLHLAGAVVSFDAERLWKLLRGANQCPMWHYHIIDVEALAAGWLVGSFSAIQEVGKNPEADGPTVEEVREAWLPWDSNALSLAVGVDPEDFDRHTALGDCRWAKAIYENVMGCVAP